MQPTTQGKFAGFGRKIQMQSLPADAPALTFENFALGYVAGAEKDEIKKNGSPYALNTEVDNKNRIMRAPGTTLVEEFADDHAPTQLVVHGNLNGRTELVFFDPPFVGVKQLGATTWFDAGIPGVKRYTSTVFGGVLLFTNGRSKVFARQAESSAIEELEEAPPAYTLCSAFNRVFAGGCIINGNFEPLGIRWSAANSDYKDWTGLGASGELLLDDTAIGDRIVTMLSMGLDFIAVMLRRAVWVGRRTNNALHPAQFRPQVPNKGAETAELLFLGLGPLDVPSLYKEDPTSLDNFGVPMDTPVWEFPFTDGELADEIFTYKGVTLSYSGEGTVSFWFPDEGGDLRQVVTQVLDLKATQYALTIPIDTESGMAVGAQMELITGDVRVSRVSIQVMERGPVISDPPIGGRSYP
jgi:hypothetical protein